MRKLVCCLPLFLTVGCSNTKQLPKALGCEVIGDSSLEILISNGEDVKRLKWDSSSISLIEKFSPEKTFYSSSYQQYKEIEEGYFGHLKSISEKNIAKPFFESADNNWLLITDYYDEYYSSDVFYVVDKKGDEIRALIQLPKASVGSIQALSANKSSSLVAVVSGFYVIEADNFLKRIARDAGHPINHWDLNVSIYDFDGNRLCHSPLLNNINNAAVQINWN